MPPHAKLSAAPAMASQGVRSVRQGVTLERRRLRIGNARA
jgi:hypothetical protein